MDKRRAIDAGRGVGRRECDDSERDREEAAGSRGSVIPGEEQ